MYVRFNESPAEFMWFLGWRDSGKSCITLDLQTTEVPRVFGTEDAVVQDVLHPEWEGGSFEGHASKVRLNRVSYR